MIPQDILVPGLRLGVCRSEPVVEGLVLREWECWEEKEGLKFVLLGADAAQSTNSLDDSVKALPLA